MPYPDPQQDSGGLLTEDQVMALVNSLYRGGGTTQDEYRPLQVMSTNRNGEDAGYYPPARDSSGNLMNPGEPNAVPPITPPPSMASPERIRQWETLQAGVRKMSPAEADAGLAEAARLERQFIAEQKNAQEVGQDREFTRAFLATTRVQDAYKVIQAAKRFQAMRNYQRAVKGGMSPIQALNENPGMFGADAGVVRAAEAGLAGQIVTPSGGQPMIRTASGSFSRITPPPSTQLVEFEGGQKGFASQGETFRPISDEGGLSAAEARPIAIKQSQANRLSQAINTLFPNDPNRKAMQAQLKALEDEITKMALGKTPERSVIAPPSGVGPAGGSQSVFASSAEARAAGHGSGDKVRIKGVGLVQLR